MKGSEEKTMKIHPAIQLAVLVLCGFLSWQVITARQERDAARLQTEAAINVAKQWEDIARKWEDTARGQTAMLQSLLAKANR